MTGPGCSAAERCRRTAHCFPADCRHDCHFRPFVHAVAPLLVVTDVDPRTSALRAAVAADAARDGASAPPVLKLQLLTRASAQRQLRVWLVLPPQPAPTQLRWLDAVCAAGPAGLDLLQAALAALPSGGTVIVPRSARLRADKCVAWGCTWELDSAPRWPLDEARDFSRAALAFIDRAMRSVCADDRHDREAIDPDTRRTSRLNGHLRLRTGAQPARRALDPLGLPL